MDTGDVLLLISPLQPHAVSGPQVVTLQLHVNFSLKKKCDRSELLTPESAISIWFYITESTRIFGGKGLEREHIFQSLRKIPLLWNNA